MIQPASATTGQAQSGGRAGIVTLDILRRAREPGARVIKENRKAESVTAWFEATEVKRIGLKNLMLAKPGFVDDEEGRE